MEGNPDTCYNINSEDIRPSEIKPITKTQMISKITIIVRRFIISFLFIPIQVLVYITKIITITRTILTNHSKKIQKMKGLIKN